MEQAESRVCCSEVRRDTAWDFASGKSTGNVLPAISKFVISGGFSMSSLENKVKKIIMEQLDVTEEEVTDTATFVDDLGADSLDMVEMVMAFEEEFGIEIPDEDAEKIKTVQNSVEYLTKKTAK